MVEPPSLLQLTATCAISFRWLPHLLSSTQTYMPYPQSLHVASTCFLAVDFPAFTTHWLAWLPRTNMLVVTLYTSASSSARGHFCHPRLSRRSLRHVLCSQSTRNHTLYNDSYTVLLILFLFLIFSYPVCSLYLQNLNFSCRHKKKFPLQYLVLCNPSFVKDQGLIPY